MIDSASANRLVGWVQMMAVATRSDKAASTRRTTGVEAPRPCASASISVPNAMNAADRIFTAAMTRARRSLPDQA